MRRSAITQAGGAIVHPGVRLGVRLDDQPLPRHAHDGALDRDGANRTGATGSVAIGNENVNSGIWSREWVVTTGRGTVVVTWDYLVSTSSNCLQGATLRAQAPVG